MMAWPFGKAIDTSENTNSQYMSDKEFLFHCDRRNANYKKSNDFPSIAMGSI